MCILINNNLMAIFKLMTTVARPFMRNDYIAPPYWIFFINHSIYKVINFIS